jgi:nicotinate-nucleotide pyrophosphorylase (carboxylating)
VNLEPLDPGVYRELVRRALAEDLGWGDVTTGALVEPGARAVGRLVACTDLVTAGLDVALETFRQLDPAVVVGPVAPDGEWCRAGDAIATLRGLAAPMLTAERTALNFLCHLSGIATATRVLVEAADGRVEIADTRKTLPVLRAIEKYAVRAGGGQNGRLSLDDGIIIKRSHLKFGAGVGDAVRRAHASHPDVPVQVEVETPDEAEEAAAAGAVVAICHGRVPGLVRDVIERVAGRLRVEVSGGFTAADVVALADAGAGYVSLGALTCASPAAEILLDVEPA